MPKWLHDEVTKCAEPSLVGLTSPHRSAAIGDDWDEVDAGGVAPRLRVVELLLVDLTVGDVSGG